jgi:hypothetical protein
MSRFRAPHSFQYFALKNIDAKTSSSIPAGRAGRRRSHGSALGHEETCAEICVLGFMAYRKQR